MIVILCVRGISTLSILSKYNGDNCFDLSEVLLSG